MENKSSDSVTGSKGKTNRTKQDSEYGQHYSLYSTEHHRMSHTSEIS